MCSCTGDGWRKKFAAALRQSSQNACCPKGQYGRTGAQLSQRSGCGSGATSRCLSISGIALHTGYAVQRRTRVAPTSHMWFVERQLASERSQCPSWRALLTRFIWQEMRCTMLSIEAAGGKTGGKGCAPEVRTAEIWAFRGLTGGEGGIRTPDTLASMPHFECGAFDHSATSPRGHGRPLPARRTR